MSEFRPSLASIPAPKPSLLRRRSALIAALAALVALVATAWWRDAPGEARSPATAPTTTAERSAWDRAIEAVVGDKPAPAPAPGSDDMPGRPALAATELRPAIVGGTVAGYAIGGEVPPELAEAGLRTGDILATIDGLPIDAARARRLADEFGSLDDVEVTYTRDGQLRDTLIVFRER